MPTNVVYRLLTPRSKRRYVIRVVRALGLSRIRLHVLPLGKALKLRTGKSIAILMFGSLLTACQEAADTLDASLVNMRFIKPLDEHAAGIGAYA